MALPKNVIFRIRINGNVIGRLAQAGVEIIDRSKERQVEIIDGHKVHRGIDFYFRDGRRMNAAGWEVARTGSGIEMRAFNPPDEETKLADSTRAMTLEQVPIDLARVGYFVSRIQVVKVPGEKRGMGFLEMVFEKKGEEGIGLDDRLLEILNGIVDSNRRSVWVYWNPIPETFQIAANTVVTPEALEAVTDHQNLHCAVETVEGGEEFLRWYSMDRKTDPSTASTTAA